MGENEIMNSVVVANEYAIISIKSPKDSLAIHVGGMGVMQELALLLKDGDIIVQTGGYPDKCLLILDKSHVQCLNLVEQARANFDKKFVDKVE